jgi:uncharacterized protein DUF5818
MTRMILSLPILILLSAGISIAARHALPADKFIGEIMDAQCGMAKSHDVMKAKEGARDAKECTLACLKQGGKVVLFDTENKKVYQLDDPTKLERFAGQRVAVTGSYDNDNNSIHVKSVQPLS